MPLVIIARPAVLIGSELGKGEACSVSDSTGPAHGPPAHRGPALQVQNKLDGCCYAVKRIPINPASRHFRRIKGEVTLLSRLHHENIVRYYNAWIERHERPAGPGTPPPDSGPPAPSGCATQGRPAEDCEPDSVEAAAPPPILSSSVEWSTSAERSATAARFPGAGPGSSSDEDDEDEDEHGGVFSQSFL